MQRPTNVGANAHITLNFKSRSLQKESTQTSYYEALSYLLQTSATYNVVSKKDADMTQSTELWKKPPIKVWKVFRNKVLWWERKYYEYVMKGNFIERLS